MTPRERILAAFRHEVPDRTPTDGWFHDEVRQRLLAHYQTDKWSVVLRELGIEGWAGLSPWISFPEFEARATPRPNGKKGPKAVWHDERTYENAWGVIHRVDERNWYEEWISGPLQNAETVEDVLAYPFPTPERVREPQDYAEKIAELKRQGKFINSGISNPYKDAWLMRGMENLLADYLINVEMLEALYDKLYAAYSEKAVRATRAGVDMISVTGDIAMQDRIIMGPEAWRKIDKPRMATLIGKCRAVNPDVFFFIHSDGNVSDLMDDLVEIGFNVVNPIQPECMDPVEVKKRWGAKITIHGGVSLQRTLPNGTPAEVRAEIEHLIINCGRNGGLVVFPSNVIQPDTSVENIIACFHAARDFKLR
jgi:uroporphyrinogen decarboxylase